jgi:putative transposase
MQWAEKCGISIEHIQPGKPQQNAYIERYNRKRQIQNTS